MSFLFSHSNSKHSPLLYVLWFRTYPADLDPGSQHTDLGAAAWTFLLRSPRCTWRPGSHLGVPWEPTGGQLSLASSSIQADMGREAWGSCRRLQARRWPPLGLRHLSVP